MKIKSLTILFFSFICSVNFAQNSLDFEFAGVYHNKHSYGFMDNSNVATDSLGNHYVISKFNGSHDLDPSANEHLIEVPNEENGIFLAKYTSNGELTWSKIIQSPNIFISDIQVDGLGGIYISGGYTDSLKLDFESDQVIYSPGFNNRFLAKYTNDGELVWCKLLNSGSAFQFSVDWNNDIIIICRYTYSIDIGSIGGPHIITGSLNNILLAKFASNGDVVWSKSGDVISNLIVEGIGSDRNGNIYFSGGFNGTFDADLGTGSHLLISSPWNNQYGTYFCKYDANGNIIWAELITGYSLSIQSFDVNKSGEFALTGRFGGQYDFDVFSGQKILTALSGDNRFLVKYDSSCNIIYANKISSSTVVNEAFQKILLDEAGNCYMLGKKQFTVYTENDTLSYPSPLYNEISDLVRFQFDSIGEVMNASVFETTSETYNTNEGFSNGLGISLGQDGNLVVLGEVAAYVDMDQTTNTLYPPIANSYFLSSFIETGEINWCSFIGKNPGTSHDVAVGIAFEEQNSYFVTGNYLTEVDLDFSQDTSFSTVQPLSVSSYLCHYNEFNELLWSQSFAGNSAIANIFVEPILDTEGNVIVVMEYKGTLTFTTSLNNYQDSTPPYAMNIALFKFNSDGGLIWARKIFTKEFSNLSIRDVEINVNNGILITGYFKDTLDFNFQGADTSVISNGGKDLFVTRLNPDGEIMWLQTLGSLDEDEGFQILPDGTNYFYLAGVFSGSVNFSLNGGSNQYVSPNSQTTFFARYSNTGNLEYIKMFSGSYAPYINEFKKDGAGNLIFAGNFAGTVDFNPSSSTYNLSSQGNSAWIAKYSNSGNFLWGKAFTSSFSSGATTFIVDSSNNILLGGYYNDKIQFSDNSALYRKSAGSQDIYLVYLSKDGQVRNVYTFGGLGTDRISHISYSKGLVGIAGLIDMFKMDLDPSINVSIHQASQNRDGFIAKYNLCVAPEVSIIWNFITMTASTSGVDYQWIDAATNEAIPGATQQSFTPTEDGSYYVVISTADGCSSSSQTLDIVNLGLEEIQKGQITLYPNPTSSLITIKIENPSESYRVSVYSLSGAPVLTQTLSGNTVYDLDASDWSQGVYLIRLDSENDSQVFKIIKN